MKKLTLLLVSLVAALVLCPALALADDAQKPDATMDLTTQGSLATQASDVLTNNGVYAIYSSMASNSKLLDVSGGSATAGANVQLYASNNSNAQYWIAQKVSDGYYKFLTLNGSNALATGASVVNGTNVNVAKASSNSGTVWKVVKNSDNTFTLHPKGNEGFSLDISGASTANGANAQSFANNGTKAQKFVMKSMPGLTAAYANGKTASNGTYTIASTLAANRVVDISGAATWSGANVQLYTSNGTFAQKFKLIYVDKGLYRIQSVVSGKVLDVTGGSSTPGANVQQYDGNNTLAQYWYLVKSGSNYQIMSAQSGLALEVAGGKTANSTNICVNTKANAAKQIFTLSPTPAISDGTYVLQSAVISPMVLDISGGSTASGANVQTWRSNGTNAQKFTIKHIGDNVYTIMNVGSGKYLDVSGGSKSSGANVWQYNYNGTDAQKWRAEVTSGGRVVFKNVGSGMVLDVSGASPRRGANVQQWNANGTAAQGFFLKDANWTFYAGASPSAMRYITKAEEYEGWEYQWGGRSPRTSFDCSGLVMYCANQALGKNYDLYSTSASTLSTMCTRISAAEARPGDLVFYYGTYNHLGHISHVVIYCGDGVMYGAGDPIGYSRVDSIRNLAGQPANYFYARMR